jgi:hypothetical protein
MNVLSSLGQDCAAFHTYICGELYTVILHQINKPSNYMIWPTPPFLVAAHARLAVLPAQATASSAHLLLTYWPCQLLDSLYILSLPANTDCL